MDEAEWLACTDARRMLDYLEVYHKVARTKRGRRKLRLFGCACCRARWDQLGPAGRRAVEVAERFAEGRATLDDLTAAYAEGQKQWEPLWYHARSVLCHKPQLAADAMYVGARPEAGIDPASVVRDLFGNPFRPLPARHFPTHVVALARSIDDGETNLHPLLADALADLGEESAAEHCRQPRHFRGCHVVDWALGRGQGV